MLIFSVNVSIIELFWEALGVPKDRWVSFLGDCVLEVADLTPQLAIGFIFGHALLCFKYLK